MFVRARRAAVLLAVLGLISTGCGSSGGSKPVSLPSLPDSASASVSPSPTSGQDEKAAVEAVVRRYYALLNAKTSLEQANAIEAITSSGCHCRSVVSAIRRAVAERRYFIGINHVNALVANLDAPALADVLVDYDYTRSGVADASGQIISAERGRTGAKKDVRLVRQGGSWLITDVVLVADGSPA